MTNEENEFIDFTKLDTNDFPNFPSVEIKSVSVKTNLQSPKVNPFTVISQVEKERKESFRKRKERKKPSASPPPLTPPFSVFLPNL